jgi:CMP-N-acetylneuraminic acid synthetase
MILGVTPARGGSKGIPKKNIKRICGKPLIVWTIEAAKQSKLLDRFVVSTDDEEIAGVSKKWGAEVINRPSALATDEATTIAVLQDLLTKVKADTVVLLQCTSPVRTPGLIDQCIEKYRDTGADAVATGYLCNIFEWGTYSARRQELSPFFHDDGNVYVINAKNIKQGDLFAGKRETVIVPHECSFEIDDEFDFWINEKILKHRGTIHD